MPSITLNIFIFTLKGAGFGTPEQSMKSLFSCFKDLSDFKCVCFKSPEIMSMLRMVSFYLACKLSDISFENEMGLGADAGRS